MNGILKGCNRCRLSGVPSAVSKDKSFVFHTQLEGLENIGIWASSGEKLGIRVFVGQGCELSPVSRHQEIQSGPEQDKTILGMYLGNWIRQCHLCEWTFPCRKERGGGELDISPFFHLKEGLSRGRCELRCSGAHLQRIRNQYYPQTEIGDIFTKHGDEPAILSLWRTGISNRYGSNHPGPDYVVMEAAS